MPITTATQMRWTSTAGALKGEGGGRAREWGGEGGREQRGREEGNRGGGEGGRGFVHIHGINVCYCVA